MKSEKHGKFEAAAVFFFENLYQTTTNKFISDVIKKSGCWYFSNQDSFLFEGGIFIRKERNIFCGHVWEKGGRENNEDSLIFVQMRKKGKNRILAVLCDGIGGFKEGEQASSYVVRQLADWFMAEGYKLEGKQQKRILTQLCFQLHEDLKNYGREKNLRLGTTLTCVLMDEKNMIWVHCGDCRLYLLGKRKVRILTKEHHDSRGNLIRAIGCGEWQLPDAGSRKIRKGERFLLCTDGLYRRLEKEELRVWAGKEIESDGQADRMLRLLYEKKIAGGEKDNLSGLYFGTITKRE